LVGATAAGSSIGDDCILCAMACGIALLALTDGVTSTGTAAGRSACEETCGSASEGAGFAGGRSAADGNAVGGDEIEFAIQSPLADAV
jgi:hypothetical protein